MLFNPDLIPLPAMLMTSLLMLAGLSAAIRYAPWSALREVPARVHLVLGASLGCTGLWLMRVQLGDVASVHLLAMTSVTLVLGWCLAVVAGSLALLAQVLLSGESLAAIPTAWLFTVATPASLTALLLTWLPRRQNLFLYTLGAGFAGGMLCALVVALLATLFLWMVGQGTLALHALESAPMLALVLFPEGFINGMLVTAACVFFPGAVKTFDERLYFGEDENNRQE